MRTMDSVIDDLSRPFPQTPLGTAWEVVTDGVMGGVSRGQMRRDRVAGRDAIRMTGDVRTENNGGFVQMALDLLPGGGAVDASGWTGIAVDVCGSPEEYNLHLRTSDIVRPWQSYRCSFRTTADWQRLSLPFADFAAHRTEAPLDLRRLRRIGIVAIGRAFRADLAMGRMALYL
jgi:hypothetical protein